MACSPFRFVALLLLLTAVTTTSYEANKRHSAASHQTLVIFSISVVRYGSASMSSLLINLRPMDHHMSRRYTCGSRKRSINCAAEEDGEDIISSLEGWGPHHLCSGASIEEGKMQVFFQRRYRGEGGPQKHI